jgi:hypothetical protein
MPFATRQAMLTHWTKYATKHLVGRKITGVHLMDADEQAACGWDRAALVIQLDNHTVIFPSQDDEGNGPGALFGQTLKGESLTFPVID